ncbi:D-aminoacyl-tRNA deacylase [Euryarchaeota archaeon]|nr:D-aminoacyl-tRNA deacylase [Euryarchaeota archaeon]
MASLILSSTLDEASMNLARALSESSDWQNTEDFAHGRVRRHAKMPVTILEIDELHIHADNIDRIHMDETGSMIDEVLVLSRHVSSTNTPAITLHAIGLPGESPPGEKGVSGGVNGYVVPPSPRFASLYRKMLEVARKNGLEEDFDLTMETTHHGPKLDTPTLYIEIGSTKSEWNRKDAALVWSSVICEVLGLNGGSSQGDWKGSGSVMVGFGGGHYAPRHKSVVELGNFWLGHVLANYSLRFEQPEDGSEIPGGNWRESASAAIEATRMAFPGGEIFAHLDKKSFRGWQRSSLVKFLEENDVPVLRGRDLSQE